MSKRLGLVVPACLIGLFAIGCGPKPDMHDMKMPERSAELDKLDSLVGDWDYTIEFTMAGMDKPMTGSGTSHIEWACDKNVLMEHVYGAPDEHGFKFAGLAIYTYDAHDKVFHTVWMDNMGEMTHGTMKMDETGKVWQTKGSSVNTNTGEKGIGKGTMKWVDSNTMEWSGTHYDSWGMSKKMTMKGTSKRKM